MFYPKVSIGKIETVKPAAIPAQDENAYLFTTTQASEFTLRDEQGNIITKEMMQERIEKRRTTQQNNLTSQSKYVVGANLLTQEKSPSDNVTTRGVSQTVNLHKTSAKRKIQGYRLALLIVAVYTSLFAMFLIYLVFQLDYDNFGGLWVVAFLICGAVLFWGLFFRKEKNEIFTNADAPETEKHETPVQTKYDNECCLFSYSTAHEAMMNRSFEEIEDFSSFGSDGEGYSWGDGIRRLCRCKKCGALFLHYKMNFLPMTYEQDDVGYSYYFPVTTRTEALEYSEKHIAPTGLKDLYNGMKIWFDGKEWCWDKPEKE
jgi:hypothetical protein